MVALKRTHRARSMIALIISTALHLCIIASISLLISKDPKPAGRPTRVSIRTYNSENRESQPPGIVRAPQQDKVSIDAPESDQSRGPQPEPENLSVPRIDEFFTEFASVPTASNNEAIEPAVQSTLPPEPGSSVQPLHEFTVEVIADPALATGTEFKRLFSEALVFPETARRAGRSGAVSLIVSVSMTGTIESVRITASSGSSLLDSAARTAAESIVSVPPPGRRLELAIRAVFSAGKASLSP